MTVRPEGAFKDCLLFAAEQTREWIPRWLTQLNLVLQQQESSARSADERHAGARARMALETYRERVGQAFSSEVALLLSGAGVDGIPTPGVRESRPLALEDLQLVDHGQVQQKIDFSRVQQLVKMSAKESVAKLNVLLARAVGREVAAEEVNEEVNPVQPGAVVSALTRALAGLQVDESVRALWMQAGAVPLGAELRVLYDDMANLLRNPRNGASASPRGKQSSPSSRGTGSVEQAPPVTLDRLHALLAAKLQDSGASTSSGIANDLAYPLAGEVVSLMMRRVTDNRRLLRPLRNMVHGLQPGLMQLAHDDPKFFANPANAARQLLDAISLQGSSFLSEQDPGFSDFVERIEWVQGALQPGDSDFPMRLDLSLRVFTTVTSANSDLEELELDPPDFEETEFFDREYFLKAQHPSVSNGYRQ